MIRFNISSLLTIALSVVPAFFAPAFAENEGREGAFEHAVRTPFTGQCVATGVPSEVLTPTCSISVPADKRLTVEFVSAEMYFSSGRLAQLAVQYATNRAVGRQLYNPVDSGVMIGGIQVSTVSSPARLSADPGTSLNFYFFAENGSTVQFGGQGFVWVTGYLTELR